MIIINLYSDEQSEGEYNTRYSEVVLLSHTILLSYTYDILG